MSCFHFTKINEYYFALRDCTSGDVLFFPIVQLQQRHVWQTFGEIFNAVFMLHHSNGG